jgi:L-2,4-diaminobutyrate decarboxylase
VVASTVLDGRRCLKFTFLNPATTAADVERVLDLIRAAARDTAPRPLEAVAGAR